MVVSTHMCHVFVAQGHTHAPHCPGSGSHCDTSATHRRQHIRLINEGAVGVSGAYQIHIINWVTLMMTICTPAWHQERVSEFAECVMGSRWLQDGATASDYVLNVGGQCVEVSISRVCVGAMATSIQILGYNYASSVRLRQKCVRGSFLLVMKHAFLKYESIEQIYIKSHAPNSV